MSVLIRLGFVLGWCLSGHAFTRPGEGAMGNGIRPLEKTLGSGGPSEQYIEHQKATIDLIQWGRVVTFAC